MRQLNQVAIPRLHVAPPQGQVYQEIIYEIHLAHLTSVTGTI